MLQHVMFLLLSLLHLSAQHTPFDVIQAHLSDGENELT